MEDSEVDPPDNSSGSAKFENVTGDDVLQVEVEESQNQKKGRLDTCIHPFMASSYPRGEDPPCFRRFWHVFLCPPHGRFGAVLFVALFACTGWATLISMTGTTSLPGGNLFSLFFFFIACWSGGYLLDHIHMPPLLGMLLMGCFLGNVPIIDIGKDINSDWSSGCRLIALCVILLRAGLGLDPKALKRLSFVVIRLAFSPCLVEAIVDGIASHVILGFPWGWGFMLGFVIAAVSPAVVVPCMLSLADKGYGLDKGVPTLVIAASSIDDVLAITGFGVAMGICFSSGNLIWTLVKGPLEAVVGILYGIVTGVICWYIPQESSENLVLFRTTLLMTFSLMAVFGSRKVGWPGSGPLGALTLAFIAALRWRKGDADGERNPVEKVEGVMWLIFQPLLFGLIGAEVNVSTLDPKTIGLGLAVLGIGLIFRMITAFIAVHGTNLSLKERIFIPIAWLPKATVQAAIGAVAYDTAKDNGDDQDQIDLGKEILTMAVVSIIVTAPVGQLLMAIFGPVLLNKNPEFGKRKKSEGLELKTWQSITRVAQITVEDPNLPTDNPDPSVDKPDTSVDNPDPSVDNPQTAKEDSV